MSRRRPRGRAGPRYAGRGAGRRGPAICGRLDERSFWAAEQPWPRARESRKGGARRARTAGRRSSSPTCRAGAAAFAARRLCAGAPERGGGLRGEPPMPARIRDSTAELPLEELVARLLEKGRAGIMCAPIGARRACRSAVPGRRASDPRPGRGRLGRPGCTPTRSWWWTTSWPRSTWEQELYCLGLPPEIEARFEGGHGARQVEDGSGPAAHHRVDARRRRRSRLPRGARCGARR